MKNHIAITSCPEVAEIMLPQLQKHSMTVFNYYKIYFDSSMVRLSSDSAWAEHYFKKNYQDRLGVPQSYLTKPVNYYLWLTDDCPEMLLDAALNFNMSNGISIAKKHPDYIEYFCFATTLNNTSIINNFYLNNLDILQKYCFYFKDKAKLLLRKSEKNKILLTNTTAYQVDSQAEEMVYCLSEQLSERQYECARLLLQGMKYKEIAHELKLSPRTIEFYISNLRNKLQCQNKTELIIKMTELFL